MVTTGRETFYVPDQLFSDKVDILVVNLKFVSSAFKWNVLKTIFEAFFFNIYLLREC